MFECETMGDYPWVGEAYTFVAGSPGLSKATPFICVRLELLTHYHYEDCND